MRFIKDSIQCLPYNPTTGVPAATSTCGDLWTQIIAESRVYQALSTRNGGEVISSDQY